MMRSLERGGQLVRLLLFVLLASTRGAGAAEDLFESVGDVDYARHVWMRGEPCDASPLAPSVPHLAARSVGCGHSEHDGPKARFEAGFEQSYRNLLSRDLENASSRALKIGHRDRASSLALRLQPAPWVGLRSQTQYIRDDRNFQYHGVGQDFGDAVWLSRNALEITASPLFVPVLSVGAGSGALSEFALGFRGEYRGLAWTWLAGNASRDVPIILDLDDYRPLEAPLLQRQEFLALSVGWRGTRWELSGTGRQKRELQPDAYAPYYSLSDSGESREITAGAAFSDSGGAGRLRVSAEGSWLEGADVFRGIRSDGTLYQFAYEETRNRNAWARVDLQLERSGWQTGFFAGASMLDWNALRPEAASGKYFWDRNGVLDSYEGNILSLFTRETWLLDGSLRFRQESAGWWAQTTARGWSLRPGLNFHTLRLAARTHATKKTSTLIIAYTEREYTLGFEGLEARLLTPELRAARRFGRATLELFAAQAVPLRVTLRGENASGPASRPGSSARSWSGGTEAHARILWPAF